MGPVFICFCGHIKSHHSSKGSVLRDGERIVTFCKVVDCDCRSFSLGNIKEVTKNGHRYGSEFKTEVNKNRGKFLSMGNLRSDGTPW